MGGPFARRLQAGPWAPVTNTIGLDRDPSPRLHSSAADPYCAGVTLFSLRSRGVRSRYFSPLLQIAPLALLVCGCERIEASVSPSLETMDIHTLDDPQRDAFAMPDAVVGSLPLTAAMVVADIGSGSGYFARRLAKRVPDGHVIAIDIDLDLKRYIEANRDRWGTPNIEPRLALDDNPVLQEKTVDLVFLSNTYSYIDDRARYFAIVHSALREEGHVVIVDFRKSADCKGAPTCPEVSARTGRATAIDELEASGFVLETEETFLPYQYLLVFRRVPRDKSSTE